MLRIEYFIILESVQTIELTYHFQVKYNDILNNCDSRQ